MCVSTYTNISVNTSNNIRHQEGRNSLLLFLSKCGSMCFIKRHLEVYHGHSEHYEDF